MLTKDAAINLSKEFIEDLRKMGYSPRQAYLFGSYANGTAHEYSDIDLAVWDDKFTGCLSIDWDPIKYLLVNYTLLEPHTYNSGDNEESNPFIAIVKQKGIQIL
jgi:predicted nucleotidyltransferase